MPRARICRQRRLHGRRTVLCISTEVDASSEVALALLTESGLFFLGNVGLSRRIGFIHIVHSKPGVRTMADMTANIRTQQQTRIRALTFPREHGAWGLLLIPLITGACIGIPHGHGPANLILFLTAALSIFWLRTPLESYFGMGLMHIGNDEERKAVLRTIGVLAPVVALSLG